MFYLNRIVSNSGYSITSISYRNWSSRDNLSSALLVNAMPNYLLLYRLINTNELKLRKRICIKQNEHAIHSTFCPILSKKQIQQNCLVTSGSEDFGVYIYDMENDEKPLINKLQGHSAVVKDVSFNYDQSLLASADNQVFKFFSFKELLSEKRFEIEKFTFLFLSRFFELKSNFFRIVHSLSANFALVSQDLFFFCLNLS